MQLIQQVKWVLHTLNLQGLRLVCNGTVCIQDLFFFSFFFLSKTCPWLGVLRSAPFYRGGGVQRLEIRWNWSVPVETQVWGFLRDRLVPWLLQAGVHQPPRRGLASEEAAGTTDNLMWPDCKYLPDWRWEYSGRWNSKGALKAFSKGISK